MNNPNFSSASLLARPWGERVMRILAAALQAVDPAKAVRRYMQRAGSELVIDDRLYDLSRCRKIWLIGAGKAGAPMAHAASEILGDRLDGGVIIVKEGHVTGLGQHSPVRILEASHPLPDERGVQGAQQLIDLLKGVGPDDLVIGLISGGGSALLTSPAPGLSLGDLQALTSALLACGANINEINTLRKHLDLVKGGGLAQWVAPARLATLILSDVVGDPLDVIASGPTVPDPTTFAEALGVIEKYQIGAKTPSAVIDRLQQGAAGNIPDTPKPGDPLFERVQNVIVGSNRQAAEAALAQAQAEGLYPLLLTTYLQGEARQVGRVLAGVARQVASSGQPIARPACLVAGGETTVTLRGDGSGGRNQEMALSAVAELAGLPDLALVTLATDGGDGPTDAAGAVVTGETLSRAQNLGLGPEDYLSRNNAYHFFAPLGDLLKPGPTQTNVNDLAFIFAF